MANIWYFWTSGGNYRKGLNDGKEGLPKVSENGSLHIPPHLGIIKDNYENVLANAVKKWSGRDGDLNTKIAYLENRRSKFHEKSKDKDSKSPKLYYALIFILALLELPITFIALESIFKENIILTMLGSIAFSALIVGLGDVLGQTIYKEGILRESSRLTVLLVTITIFTIAGLSYFRYVHQSNQIHKEIQRVEERADLDNTKDSSQYNEAIAHLRSTSPALISIVFFFMSSGFTLVALFLSKQHCTRRKDKVFVDEMLEYIDEKATWIQHQREKLYVGLDCELQSFIQSAQREFEEYKDGLIRSSQNTGDLMLKLEKEITERFAVEMGKSLISFPAISQKIQQELDHRVQKLDSSSSEGQEPALADVSRD
jgi:flagellar basal body-associated protein FliL